MADLPPNAGSPSPPQPAEGLAGRDRFRLRYHWRGAWVRWDVFDGEGETLLLSVVRPGHFWLNLLAGLAGLASGFAFMAVFLVLAFHTPGDAAQVVIGLTGILGGVAVLFLVDIALSPRRYFRSALPDPGTGKGKGRRPGFRLREDSKVTLFSSSFTLRSSEGEVRARIAKNYLRNLGRRRWTCRGPQGELLCQAVEDSPWRSFLYRVVGGGFGFLTTDYLLLQEGRELGRFHRRRPHHRRNLLSLNGELDPEVAVALAVITDAVEKR